MLTLAAKLPFIVDTVIGPIVAPDGTIASP